MKGRTWEKEKTVRMHARARGVQENESSKTTERGGGRGGRERKRQRKRFRFRPSGNRTRSPPFLVFNPPDPPPYVFPPILPYVLLRALLLHFIGRSDLTKVSSARLPSRRPNAKCIYVLCKASNRRWPREPDAQCVINTDALVVPFPPSSQFPLLIRLLRAYPVSAGPIAQAKRTGRLDE